MIQGHVSCGPGCGPASYALWPRNFKFVALVERAPPAIPKRIPPLRGTWTGVAFWVLGRQALCLVAAEGTGRDPQCFPQGQFNEDNQFFSPGRGVGGRTWERLAALRKPRAPPACAVTGAALGLPADVQTNDLQ